MDDQEYFYDPVADAARLKRKRELANLLMAQQAMRHPALHDAGAFKVANWGDAIGKMAMAWAASKANKDLENDESSTAAGQNKYISAMQERYNTLRQGKTKYFGDDTRALDATGGDTPEPVVQTTGPDRVRALALAMQSRVPSLMKQALEDQKEDLKLLTVPGASLESRRAALTSLDPNQLQPEPKEHVVNGQLVRDGKVVADFSDRYGPPGTIPGTDLPGQKNLRTDQYDAFRQPSNINFGEKTVLTQHLKTAEERQKSAREAQQRLYLNTEGIKLVDNAITGAGANFLLDAKRIGKLFNLTDDQIGQIRDSQSLTQTLAPNVLKALQALRPASNVDLQWSQKVQLADLASDPRALKRAIRIIAAADATEMFRARQDYDAMLRANPNFQAGFAPYSPPELSVGGDLNLKFDESRGMFVLGDEAPAVGGGAAPAPAASPTKGMSADELVDYYTKQRKARGQP